jgi:uncharacterized membrane protein YsdA (DUF1294 family)
VRTVERSPMSPAVRALSYWLSGVLLALAVTLVMEGALALRLVFGWLISINVFTLIFYSIDKINSIWVDKNEKRKALNMRIPEAALLLLALIGGSPAAVVAILILPHKTDKNWFMLRFLLILAIQAVAVSLLWEKLPWS